jgi:predicted nucleic acid-binding protein
VKKVVLDTNLYIDWINRGLREGLMVGGGLVRHLSAVVLMELRAGAHSRSDRAVVDRLARSYSAQGRLVAPSSSVYDRAGSALRQLRLAGRDVRSASFVNDVLIALSAQAIGATVITANVVDFEAIRAVVPLQLEAAGSQK